MIFAVVVCGLLIIFLLWALQYPFSSRTEHTRLLPGPPGIPIFGNLVQIPEAHPWLKFKEWAEQYGPIYQLSFAGSPHVIISSEKIANDLLRGRGNIYSSRPRLPMAAEILSHNLRPVFLPYGELWRKGRKLMHHLLATPVATSYEPIQLFESSRTVRSLIHDPQNYQRWLERYSAGVVLRLAYNQAVETGEEESVKQILEVVHTVERVGEPGAYLVDVFPFLMYLPKFLAPFKQEGERLHQRELRVFRQHIDSVRQDISSGGKKAASFARTWLERKDIYGLTDDQAAYLIGTLFEAGTGTTAAALMSFILAMVHHPHWQKRLQDEVDSVVSDARLPTFEDMPSLPTVRAVVKETLRWRPVTAGGLPHQLVQDDIYDGYFLKAGTNVHANQWAIHRDPSLYPDPDSFRPERWLESDWPTYREPLAVYPNIHDFSAFGFGRRICPGQNVAERSLNILVSRIGWACDISTAAGHAVPLYDYTTGFNVQPKPFKFELKARSFERANLVDNICAQSTEPVLRN